MWKHTNTNAFYPGLKSVYDLLPSDKRRQWRAECMTAKADCSSTTRTCVTAWTWTAWAASTPALGAARASVAWSAAVTGSGSTSRWRWRAERSSGTSLLFKLAALLRCVCLHACVRTAESVAWTIQLYIVKPFLHNVTDVYQLFYKLLPVVE